MFNHDSSITRTSGHSALSREGNITMCTFETIRKDFDWNHGEGYCVEYHVYFCNPSWSAGRWFNIEGVLPNGGLVDLLSIGYEYQYSHLVAGIYR